MIARRRYHCLRCDRSASGVYDPETENVYHCARCGMRLNVDQQLKGYDPEFAESLFDELPTAAPGKATERHESPNPLPRGCVLGSLRLAADSWQELRRGDVYRVIEDARDGGYAEEMARRIVGNRPDLEDEALTCLEELT